MRFAGVVFVAALWLPPSAAAQVAQTPHTLRATSDAQRLPATVADMAWLAGAWTGDGLGGRTEEVWSPPDGGSMMGMFRLVKDGQPVFYEFLTLGVVDGVLTMRLKHFNPDLTGWEERDKFVSFRFIGRRDGAYHFDGLTFVPNGGDAVTIYLAIRGRDGEVREERFQMRRR